MRTLKFNVKGQILRADEKCNFENIVAGSKNYLVAEFNFDREWLPYKKLRFSSTKVLNIRCLLMETNALSIVMLLHRLGSTSMS